MTGQILFSSKPTSSAPHLYRFARPIKLCWSERHFWSLPEGNFVDKLRTYRSLVREQMTITTDLELIASGTSLPPSLYVDENYTSSTFTGDGLSPTGTITLAQQHQQQTGSNNTFPNHHHHHHYAHYTQEELDNVSCWELLITFMLVRPLDVSLPSNLRHFSSIPFFFSTTITTRRLGMEGRMSFRKELRQLERRKFCAKRIWWANVWFNRKSFHVLWGEKKDVGKLSAAKSPKERESLQRCQDGSGDETSCWWW